MTSIRKAALLLTVLASLTACATPKQYNEPYGYGRGAYPLIPDSTWLMHDLVRAETYRLARERGLIR